MSPFQALDLPDKQQFLSHYWQKRPLVIRRGFTDFVDPLDEHELAGLAMEADIDSRIISLQQQEWQLSQGPFTEFEPLCRGAWTLLVQSVDQYVSAARQLLWQFNFIPHWRLDDLMASYSVAGAGVGPHLDQYDVFIIQGKGSRRWQVGDRGAYNNYSPVQGLQQVTHFEPVIDEVLESGDIIYIPAGCPHNGVALTECMNYSVGFRAPTQQELLGAFADFAAQQDLFNHRYSDPDLTARDHASVMRVNEKQQFKKMFIDMLESPHFDQFIGLFFSQPALNEVLDNPDLSMSAQQVHQLLHQGVSFHPLETAKLITLEQSSPAKHGLQLWVNHQCFPCDDAELAQLEQLLLLPELDVNSVIYTQNPAWVEQVLAKLVSHGSWFAELDDDE